MKKFILFALLVSGFQMGFSQRFMHGAGLGVFVSSAPNHQTTVPSVITYSPRVNIMQNEKNSISIGMPLSLGFTGSYHINASSSSGTNVSKQSSYLVNVPVMINFNHGVGSSKTNAKKSGIFLGVGFGANFGSFVSNNFDYNTGRFAKQDESGFGPAGNLGLRFKVGRNTKNIEARVSYMKTIIGSETSALGFAALFNF